MKSLITLLFCIPVICISLSAPVYAEEVSKVNSDSSELTEKIQKEIPNQETLSPGSAVIDKSRFIDSLKMSFIFLLLFGGVAYYFKKYKGSFKPSHKAQSALTVSEERSLGNGTSLILLKVFDEYILISKHAGKVELLKSFSGKNTPHKDKNILTKADLQPNKSELVPVITSTSPENITHAIF